MLAAILPSPLRNDPIRPTPFLLKRQQRILRWMNPRPQHEAPMTEE
jgi:membrane peptidoglycan carboxypeptidase